MKIAIIGGGMIGGTLGRLWHRAGHTIHFGSRHPEKLTQLVAELAPRSDSGTPESASRDSEVLLLAVPVFAVPSVGISIRKHIEGKLVLDASNAYPQRDGPAAAEATTHPGGSSGWVASHLQGARVVKAFNTVYFKVLLSESNRDDVDGIGIPLAGDDPTTLADAAQLVRDAGFTPVVVGALQEGKRFEPGTPVYASSMKASDVARALGVRDEKR